MKETLLTLARKILPVSFRRNIIRLTRWPPVGLVNFGSFRRVKPISPDWGFERGKPIDRYYIEVFLDASRQDIQGRVLEIGDNKYTRLFGGDQVRQSDVLHVAEDRPEVTIIGDLTRADNLDSNCFDCIIITQTMQTIFDVQSVVKTIYRILKPGGVVLATLPGISKISRYDMDRWGYFWSFTTKSARRLFEAHFPEDGIQVNSFGNVLTAIAFLHGLASGELRTRQLDFNDPDYEVLITVRAQKPS